METRSIKNCTVILTGILILVFIVILSGCRSISSQDNSQLPPTSVKLNVDPVKTQTPTTEATFEPTTTPTPEICTEKKGQISEVEIPSDYLSNPLNVLIYTSPCYDNNRLSGYPYLILLHGQSMSNDIWLDLGIEEITDEMMSNGSSIPFLIFMPKEEYYLADPWESDYEKVITESLIPWIDNEYNTCTTRDCRSIGGISRGAAWAMRLGLIRWDLFSVIGAHSYPVFRGDYNLFAQWYRDIPIENQPKVYIDIGTFDRYIEPASQFEALMTKYHYPHEWHVNNGSHNEDYWRTFLPDYLNWYAAELEKGQQLLDF